MLAPATAVIARVSVTTVAGTGYANWSIASYLQVDAFHANIGATLDPYFDGDTAGGVWSGTAHASTSTFYLLVSPAAPTLTEGSLPSPNVEVYFPVIDGDAATITVFRIADGQTEEVAGALRAGVAGDFRIIDYGVPFGVTTTYTAEIFDTAGGSAISSPGAVTVTRDEVWFSDQIDPEKAFSVDLTDVSFKEVKRSRRTERVYVFGNSRPFIQDFGIGAIEALPMQVYTDTNADADAMQLLLQSSPILIRTPPKFYTLPRSLSANIQQPTHNPQDWQFGGNFIVWTLTVDEVQPSSKAIVRPLITWNDWTTAFPSASYTWADVIAIYAAGTWTDAVRNSP
jgi:hypothetical protein